MPLPSRNTNTRDVLPLNVGEIFADSDDSAVAILSSNGTSIRLVDLHH
ncbi:hypothetical protein [Rhodopirellula bahusiensis]|nr:hypothetical protein [Rhodopirellula bahusiensis]